MGRLLFALLLIILFKTSIGTFEPFILGGSNTEITKYPHSAYLSISCGKTFICGGSIIEDSLVLTAAHCFEDCEGLIEKDVMILVGHEDIDKCESKAYKSYIVHERYNKFTISKDIAIVSVKKKFKYKVGSVMKVYLATQVPIYQKGYIAGWGATDKKGKKLSYKLKHISQRIQSPRNCSIMHVNIPRGTLCAGTLNAKYSANNGDSGSALVIDLHTQVGILSYRTNRSSISVYTSVPYYKDWIEKKIQSLLM